MIPSRADEDPQEWEVIVAEACWLEKRLREARIACSDGVNHWRYESRTLTICHVDVRVVARFASLDQPMPSQRVLSRESAEQQRHPVSLNESEPWSLRKLTACHTFHMQTA